MFEQRHISAITVLAGAFWAKAVVLIGLTIAYELPPGWGQLGILSCAVAATLNIKQFIAQLHQREVQAFEIGREWTERHGQQVRRLPR